MDLISIVWNIITNSQKYLPEFTNHLLISEYECYLKLKKAKSVLPGELLSAKVKELFSS